MLNDLHHNTRKESQRSIEADEKRKKEEERIAAIVDETEREAHKLRMKIVDDVLTLRCPRADCRKAFVDFTGCFALICSSVTCRCGFCAWCLKDCGTDALYVP